MGPEVDDPRLNELVGELSVRSERFRQLWARHDARPRRRGTILLDHPQVGPLELSYEKLPIPATNCQTLVIYHPELGTPGAQALTLLATTAAERASRSGASHPSSGRQAPDAPDTAICGWGRADGGLGSRP